MRLASALGSGGSTAKHACKVGGLYGSEVFKNPGSIISCINVSSSVCVQGAENPQLSCNITPQVSGHLRTGGEPGLHEAARRHGLALGVDVQYMQLSTCAGHTDAGEPILELKDWPVLPPHLMEPCNLCSGFCGGLCFWFDVNP